MAYVVYNANTKLHFDSNEWLALIQQVALARFRDGEGFFITGMGTNDDGDPVTAARWLHPSVPLEFVYDTGVEPITVDDELVRTMVEFSKTDIGLVIGSPEQMPFKFASEPADPVDGEDS